MRIVQSFRLVSKASVGDWIYGNFNLKTNRKVKSVKKKKWEGVPPLSSLFSFFPALPSVIPTHHSPLWERLEQAHRILNVIKSVSTKTVRTIRLLDLSAILSVRLHTMFSLCHTSLLAEKVIL